MLLSRFWYIFLAVAAGAAAGAALLSQGIINAHTQEHVADQLRRDRLELDTIMKIEARMRLDRISFITVDNKLGATLKAAAGVNDEKQLLKLASDAKESLRGHIQRMLEAAGSGANGGDLAPDLVLAVDSAGRIIGQLGSLEANPAGHSVATYPFVDRALRGYVRDDVVVYDRRVYRIAARPVLHMGEYAGAIVHGYKFDNAFVERMSQGLGGASVAFFYGTATLASFTPDKAPPLAELAAPLTDALKDEHFRKGEKTAPMPLKSGGRALYSLIVGGAALADVGYVIARPMNVVESPLDLFKNATQQDVQALPLPWLGGGAALLALLGLLFVYLERDRPFGALRARMHEVVEGKRDRLIVTEYRGKYRKLADAINQAIDKSVEKAAEMAPSNKKKANLDEILGPTPSSHVEPYFGFADSPAAKPKAQPSPPAPKPHIAPAPPPQAMAAPAAVAAPAAIPVAPAAAVPLAPAAMAAMPGARAPTPPKPAAVVPLSAPKPALTSKTMTKLGAVPAPAPANTVVAAPPPAAAATAPHASSSSPAADGFDEATHFREVYAEYLTLRRECGENSDGISYDKFENTLVKTRDQVLQKHPAKGVRFTVYVKEGKAALKAAPLKK